jgi:hypothetical protein
MSFAKYVKPLMSVSASEDAKSPSSDSFGAQHESEDNAEAGELKFDESTQGGLGRHLGLFSTTFLM